ncbi:MAG: DNA-binding protein [Planctomycetes bacterium RBG_16_55_9]|nr:MAG: DNA-binding protein [Planctomycetes bacterium RBG_16_55_9]
MNPLVTEWISKAEGDFNTAQRELQAADAPNYDAVCFHAQQCVEKYLKATLVDEGVEFEKTHDLGILLSMLVRFEPSWEELREAMNSLAGLAVEVRYPGYSAEAEDADEAVEIAIKVRRIVRQRLRLPE